jgi:Flp pilus assembly protein TadG
MLLFGVVSTGMAFNHNLSLTHAARESSRFAATLPVSNFSSEADPLRAWLDAVAARAVADSNGSLDDGVAGRTVCVAYVYPNGSLGTDQTTRVVVDPAGTSTYDALDCFSDLRPNDERRVQVQVERTVEFSALVFTTDLTLDSEAVSKFEAGPGF